MSLGQAAPRAGKPPAHRSVAPIVTHVSSDHTPSHTHTLAEVPVQSPQVCVHPAGRPGLPTGAAPSQPRALRSTASQRSARSHPRELDLCFLSVSGQVLSSSCRCVFCSEQPPPPRRPRAQSQETAGRTDEGVAGVHPWPRGLGKEEPDQGRRETAGVSTGTVLRCATLLFS